MASVKFYSDDEEDETSTDVTSDFRIVGRDSVVFAIECCGEMFRQEDGDSPFVRIITAIHEMMLNKIITSDKDLHGVIFYGTQKHKNTGDFVGIHEWLPFDVPCIDTIVKLRNMQDCDLNKFSDEFGFDKSCQVSDVLWTCLNMFSGSMHTLATKTLLLFPWNDNPHAGDDNARKRAKAKATDLLDHKVDVQVLSFNQKFKYEHLYKEIVCDPESPEPTFDNPIDCIQNLYSFLLRKCTKQRPLTRISLRLGGDLALSVGVHTVARRTPKSAYVSIDTATNEEVSRKNNMMDKNTGEILMPSDIKFQQTWGGRELVFEKEEVQRMRKISERGLTLLGFKPRSKAIKSWYHVRNSQFIYPDEKTTKGSNTLFAALLKKCLEKDVVAICNYAPRDSSPPRCVALLPQNEEVDLETSEQSSPPGFYIIFLPYADDIRKFDIPRDVPEPSSAQVEAAEAMVRRLRFPYDPENFDSPVIQTHYKNLEAMALDKADIEAIDDHTIPNYDMMEKKAGPLIRAFKEMAFPHGFSKKRGAGDGTSAAGGKRAKEDSVEIDVKEYIAQDKLSRLTVAVLKEICRNYNMKCVGKKADLINTIEEYFKRQQS